MTTAYETDIVAWANEQAALLRAGKFSALDIEHIADEVQDVGKSERRELANRLAVLLAHLLKWRVQPDRRGKSWHDTIKIQRKAIRGQIDDSPSLKATLRDERWFAAVWDDALARAIEETRLAIEDFPDACPWSPDQILDGDLP